MGPRQYPPLPRETVIAILIAARFHRDRSAGGHDVYVGRVRRVNRTVPISSSHDEIQGRILQAIIRQTGLDRREFYGLDRAAAKKINCPFLKNGLLPGLFD